jgi:hypothetical protein
MGTQFSKHLSQTSKKFSFTKYTLATAMAASALVSPQAQALPPRPPQFVLMAFDGSLNLNFWNESRQFAKTSKSNGFPLNFTYFISGVYFVNDTAKSVYDAPKHGIGKSEIGFGGDVSTIAPRVEQVNLAFEEGNEIGSHANGHFDAGIGKWTLADWTSEFTQFIHLIFDAISINRVQPVRQTNNNGYVFGQDEVIGFRAPQLGITPDMYTALANFNFKYDTSKTSGQNYWPEKKDSRIWNFPLAQLTIAGTAKRTLSMDYNFYVSQSKAVADPANKDLYKKQMIETYLAYFQSNYNGKRGPIHIGHHFSKWNGGAYWEAMQEFSKQVCGKPEVRCVTYKAYMNWLESLDATTLDNYRNGRFDNTGAPALMMADVAPIKDGVKLVQSGPGSNLVVKPATTNGDISNYEISFAVDGMAVEGVSGNQLTQEDVASLMAKNGKEPGATVQVTAQVVENDIVIQTVTKTLNNAATDLHTLETPVLEDRALLGDLPDAHADERNQ